MKKFLAAVCCTLLVASASFAQSGTRSAPAAQAVQAVSDAASAMTQAPVDATPVMSAAPMTSGMVQGSVVNSPMTTSYPMTTTQGCGCGGTVGTPVMSSAPMMMGSPDMSQSVVSAPMAAPVASGCGCGAPAPAPTCCPTQRRQVVRGAFTQMRARRSSCCCN